MILNPDKAVLFGWEEWPSSFHHQQWTLKVDVIKTLKVSVVVDIILYVKSTVSYCYKQLSETKYKYELQLLVL